MGSSPIRQFLISLCNNTHWKYAVFWKLQYQTPLILTWEDAYCDDAEPAEGFRTESDESHVNRSKGISYQSCETSILDIGSEGCQIELAVANMSCLQYAFGEGGERPWSLKDWILEATYFLNPLNHLMPPSVRKLWLVGEVAYTGKHNWVLFNSFFSKEFDSSLVPDWMDEWFCHIAMGIKTILLVPVLPDGVLQLGSLEAVAEDLAFVGFIKDGFDAYRNMIIPFTITRNPMEQSSLSPPSSPMERLNEPPHLVTSQLKSKKLEEIDIKTLKEKRFSTLKESVPQQTTQDMLVGAGNDAQDRFMPTIRNDIGSPEESVIPSLPLDVNILEMVDTKMFGFSCLEELLAYSLSSGQNAELFEESLNGVSPYSAAEMAAQLFVDDHVDDGCCQSMNSYYRFPEDSELHKALGPSFYERNAYEHFGDTSFLIEDAYTNKSSAFCNEDLVEIIEPSWFSGGGDAEHQLEEVVVNLIYSSNDALSSPSNSTPSCVASSIPSPFFQTESSKAGPGMQECLVQSNLVKPAFLPEVNGSTSLGGTTSTLTNEEKQVKVQARMQSRKGKKLSNMKASRARNGNTQKPRPRDRQLIQDRVKELRELVPNGAKCSIDGLLDRTIKHMLFLKGVPGQAKKLGGHLLQEAARDKNQRSSENSQSFQNGTSWAFEFGNDHQACPIVVEDLENPGQMLIEVLCDDHGLFLEMAQLIRRLDLTILKGVMETRSSNTWANFVVEGTKGFHRMEIFWPLLHLLQRKRSRISSKI